ncbi:MAG: ABC transporter permease subunit [Clostridia bacterium]|nr:ABC transporter permease subunit [Clostridia bacterium]
MRAKRSKLLIGAAVAVFWVTVWWLVSGSINQEILLPSPMKVAQTLWSLWGTALFWRSVALSILRILGGFAAAVAVGSLLAAVTTHSRALGALLSPILHIVQAAPVASFIILAYVWIEAQLLPAFIAFLMVVPLVWKNMSAGIENTDKNLIEMAKVFRLSRAQTWRTVRLPSLRPYFTAACTAGLGFAWKAGVAAEVICTPENSIGKQLYSAKAYLETPEVFAWTVTVVLLSVILERIFMRLVRRKREVDA